MAPCTTFLSCTKYYCGHSLPRPDLRSSSKSPGRSFPRMASGNVVRSFKILGTFSKLRREGKVALMPYITAGDPDLATTSKLLQLLDQCGADLIELGLPYSNPSLDGPVIQASTRRALANGTKLETTISMLKEVVPRLSCPIVLLSYYKHIVAYGVEKFTSIVGEGGVHGLLVPDVPFREIASLKRRTEANDIELGLITTPITPRCQMEAIVDVSEGFVYLASSVGVTGARPTVNPQVEDLLQELKEVTTKPVAVGFGISKPEHVKQIATWGADGVIVGSAIVQLLAEARSSEEALRRVEIFTKSLKAALP
ncbi:tryptophan synthase alpha chain-like [Typha latifolia]|uniref:tryptophan synthase alpha chain-like n=1 Tax=Typha latifolia TaxID=4733 RepID=UPI003C2B6697